jgi:hypothetical protein
MSCCFSGALERSKCPPIAAGSASIAGEICEGGTAWRIAQSDTNQSPPGISLQNREDTGNFGHLQTIAEQVSAKIAGNDCGFGDSTEKWNREFSDPRSGNRTSRFHWYQGITRALVKRKYRLLYSPRQRDRFGPKGPSRELIAAVVEMKRRNPRLGCRKIAEQICNAFAVEINKDVVRRILIQHYRPLPGTEWSLVAHHNRARQGQPVERRPVCGELQLRRRSGSETNRHSCPCQKLRRG